MRLIQAAIKPGQENKSNRNPQLTQAKNCFSFHRLEKIPKNQVKQS